MNLEETAEQYRRELTQNLLPFWQKHAFDERYGGVFEGLDEKGEVISTDKPIVLQAQMAWAFAFAHHRFGANEEWLYLARQTGDFLLEKGRDPKGKWYRQVDRRGTPLTAAAGIAPALYGVLALAQLHRATGEETYGEAARKTLVKVLRRRTLALKRQLDNPAGRPFKSLEEFALVGRALLEAETCTDRKWHQRTLAAYVDELTQHFYDKRSDILLEHVTPEGHFWDCPEGRMLVPGRIFEVVGFMLNIADRGRNRRLLNQMLDLAELTIRAAWDASQGGFFNQMDLKSTPPLNARWPHKPAWAQLAALPALLKGHLLSARPVFLETFEKAHDYVWAHFPDTAQGGWFAELTREGEPFVRHKLTPETNLCGWVRDMAETARLLDVVRATRPSSAS